MAPLNHTGKTVVVISSFGLAALLYRYIEQPFRDRGSRLWWPRKKFLTACAVLAAVMVGTSATALNGWTWRLPNFTQSALSVYGGTECAKPRCEHGTEGRPVYVIGESFARQLYDGLVTTFPNQKFVVFDNGSCTFFSPKWVRWVEADHAEAACVADRNRLFRELRTKKPRVIFANNWVHSQYFDADDFERTERIHVKKLVTDTDKAAFTINQIENLREELGLDVLLMGNPPSIGSIQDLDVCLSRPIQVNRKNCAVAPMSEVSDRRLLATRAKGHIPVLDPFEALCDGEQCRNYSADGLYYSDKWHLSKLGSRLLITHFKGDLSRWMGNGSTDP